MYIRLLILLAFLNLFIFPYDALAQQDTEARLNRIENEIQTLSRALFRGDVSQAEVSSILAPDAPIQAELELRVSQLENEIRTLTGLVEKQNHQVTRLRETVDSLIANLEKRVGELEKQSLTAVSTESLKGDTALLSTGSLAQDSSSTLVKTDFKGPEQLQKETLPADEKELSEVSLNQKTQSLGVLPVTREGALKELTAVKSDSPVEAYEQAFSMLREKNYLAAEEAFSNFLTLYPKHELAGNAKYWLGETFYVRGSYQRAAQEFAEAYQLYPEGSKAPDNLLKLGMSLSQLDQKEDACLALSQIKRKFSSGAGPVLNRAEQEMKKLSCM